MREESTYQNITNFLQSHLSNEQLLSKLSNQPQQIEYESHGPIDMLVEGKHSSLEFLRVPLQITSTLYEGKTIATKLYSEDGRFLGQENEFELTVPQGSARLKATLIMKPDGTMSGTGPGNITLFENQPIRSITLFGGPNLVTRFEIDDAE